jgi:hypothetical protein
MNLKNNVLKKSNFLIGKLYRLGRVFKHVGWQVFIVFIAHLYGAKYFVAEFYSDEANAEAIPILVLL